MKRKLIAALVVAFGLLASSAYAADNLLFNSTVVVPAEKDGYASSQKWGTAPSGKKALIVSTHVQKDGDVCYRMRIDFSEPLSVRSISKIHLDWEPLDADIKKAGKKEIMLSIFTLNREDNKARRAGELVYSKRGEDKKSIYQASSTNPEVPFNAVYDAEKDCQGWTDTKFLESTKQITGIEVYVNLGSVSKGDGASKGKGLAVTGIWFE